LAQLLRYAKAIIVKNGYVEVLPLPHEQEQKPQLNEPVSAAIRARLEQASALHQQSRFAEAEKILQEILQQEPTCVDALHLLGMIALRAQQFKRATALIGKAIALKPDYAEAHSDHAMVLRKLKRPAEALASYNRAIALKPNFAMAYNNRGNALLDLKRFAEALQSRSCVKSFGALRGCNSKHR
jgi:Flp pilus assembly protein TadD